MSRAEIKWAYDKWCEGYTKKEIAAALFVNPSTIKDALRGRVKKERPPLKYDFKRERGKRA